MRDAVVFGPLLVGWLLAAYSQFQAFRNLRKPRPSERLFTLFFGEFGTRLYTFEGHRYRVFALIAFVSGTAVTIILDLTLRR